MDTRRSYYLACRQDDFAEAPAETLRLESYESCMPLQRTTIRQANLGCQCAAGSYFVAWLLASAQLAELGSMSNTPRTVTARFRRAT